MLQNRSKIEKQQEEFCAYLAENILISNCRLDKIMAFVQGANFQGRYSQLASASVEKPDYGEGVCFDSLKKTFFKFHGQK